MTRFISLLATATVLCWSTGTPAWAQTAEFQSTFSQSQLTSMASAFGIPSNLFSADHDVEMYRVTYPMPYLGDTVDVSGALFVPMGFEEPCGLPIHVYMHGTLFKRTDAPSFLGSEGIFGGLMATLGQLVLMPDYVGLGTSQLMHPYVHAQSESDAGYFMMKAADALSGELGFTLNGQNFLSGYSQGGHAAMALARDLTTTAYGDDFTLSGAAPGSGPYDISGTQFPMTFDAESYSNPAYLAYNVVGWNSVYGTLYDNLDEVFQEPYASAMLDLLDGTHDAETINDACPPTLEEFVQPNLLDDILNNPDHPFNLAAQDNDVYQWIPEAPLEMYYCTQDEQVFYENALVAESWMTSEGSTMHEAIDLGALDHGQCAGLAILGASLWIEDRVEACTDGLPKTRPTALSMHPNPASDQVRLAGANPSTPWKVIGVASGQVVLSGRGETVRLESLSPGMWLIQADGLGRGLLSVAR